MKNKLALYLVLGIISAIACAQLYIAHQLSTAGIDMTLLQREITELDTQNEDLRHKIASASSLRTISTKATELGFVKASFQYIQQSPVAFKQ